MIQTMGGNASLPPSEIVDWLTLTSHCKHVSSVESLAMFLYIVGGSQSFSHAENQSSRSTRIVHMKFKEVLLCL
jgi:hypothetical protein